MSYLDGMGSTQLLQEKDRELVKQAAYAAEIGLEEGSVFPRRMANGAVVATPWNPLENLDDALSLAAKLHMTISYGVGSVCVTLGTLSHVADIRPDEISTTCRAIVETVVEAKRQREENRTKGRMS